MRLRTSSCIHFSPGGEGELGCGCVCQGRSSTLVGPSTLTKHLLWAGPDVIWAHSPQETRSHTTETALAGQGYDGKAWGSGAGEPSGGGESKQLKRALEGALSGSSI